MNLKYKLQQQDYLQQVLYSNSISENSKKQRLRAWIFVISIIVFINFLILYLFRDNIKLGHYLGAIPMSVLAIFFFPYFHKKILKIQFIKFVNEVYKNNFGKETNLTFHQNIIEIHNSTGASKVPYSSLQRIIEISSHIFLVLKAGAYIILPKSEIKNGESVRSKLNDIATKNEILYATELEWKWK